MDIMENYLTAPTRLGLMDLFVAAPPTDKKLPVIIVLQEAYGVNEHIKEICKRLAMHGYVAVAPELFHRIDRHVTIDYSVRGAVKEILSQLSNEGLLEDVRTTLNFIKGLPDTDMTKVFTLGFCMGGFTSLLTAANFPIQGAIAFYGAGVVHPRPGIGLTPFINDFSLIHCPLLLFYGEQDASIPAHERNEIADRLRKLGKDFELEVFQADHGFFCEDRKSYDQVAASSSWKKMLQWLEQKKCAYEGAFQET